MRKLSIVVFSALCLMTVGATPVLAQFDDVYPTATGTTPPPETTIPEYTIPEYTTETTIPEYTVPEETTIPEYTVPEETTSPETTTPETTSPETTTPETTSPETTTPETTSPETTTPETPPPPPPPPPPPSPPPPPPPGPPDDLIDFPGGDGGDGPSSGGDDGGSGGSSGGGDDPSSGGDGSGGSSAGDGPSSDGGGVLQAVRDFLFGGGSGGGGPSSSGGGDPSPEAASDPDTGSPLPDIGSPSPLGAVVGSLAGVLALVGLAASSLLVARRIQGVRADSAARDGSSDEVGERAASAGAGAVNAFTEGRAAAKAAGAAGGGGEGVQAETVSDLGTEAADERASDPVLVGWVPGKQCIRLLVADEQPNQRSEMREMLESQPDFEVIAEATSGTEAVELTDELRPRVVLMDLSIPEVDGATATAQIKGEHRGTYVLVTTTTKEEEEGEADISRAIEAGASGYLLLKDTSREELFRAVRLAAQGEPLAPEVDGA